MENRTVIAGSVAVLFVAVLVAGILFSTRDNRVRLSGEVLRVRSFAMAPDRTLGVVDFRIHNPSTQQFVIREIEVFVDGKDAEPVVAEVFSEDEGRRILDYYKVLGQKDNPGLLVRDRIQSGQTLDRTIAISAPMADAQLSGRTRLRIVATDVDGAKTEINEKR